MYNVFILKMVAVRERKLHVCRAFSEFIKGICWVDKWKLGNCDEEREARTLKVCDKDVAC